MILAILIILLVILILATSIELNIKSANDTIKIDAKFGLIKFVIPHHKLIKKALEKEKNKDILQQRDDLKKLFDKRHYLNRLFKHSSLTMFYIGKFTKEQVYLNPIVNGAYLIASHQTKAYLINHFKYLDESNISLVYDPKYENIDYYISIKSDFISLLTAFIRRK